jgi:hypothetical protein
MESHESRPANGQREKVSDGGTLGERVDRMSDSAQQVWSRTRDAFGDIKGTLDLDGRVKRHPYGTLAAAVGIGYVLGGGLFSRLTARILGMGLRIGMRLAAIPVIKDELAGLVGEEDEGGAKSRAKSQTTKGRQP